MRRVAKRKPPHKDPYHRCVYGCTHDLVPGVLVREELLEEDGPYDDNWGNRLIAPVAEMLP